MVDGNTFLFTFSCQYSVYFLCDHVVTPICTHMTEIVEKTWERSWNLACFFTPTWVGELVWGWGAVEMIRLGLCLKLADALTLLHTSSSGRMRISLRSQLRSNLVFPLSGFALINSIMSLFDVELNKTLRGHTSASSGLYRALAEGHRWGKWHQWQTCWRTHGQPISWFPCWFSSCSPSSDPLPQSMASMWARYF